MCNGRVGWGSCWRGKSETVQLLLGEEGQKSGSVVECVMTEWGGAVAEGGKAEKVQAVVGVGKTERDGSVTGCVMAEWGEAVVGGGKQN
jgi:hypothetical protein